MTKQKLVPYRVWIAQVNQKVVEVNARNADEAMYKGYAKWRREEAHSTVRAVERQDPKTEHVRVEPKP